MQRAIETRAATQDERDEFLRLIRGHLGADFDSLQGRAGLSWPEFEALYRTRGEVRAIKSEGAVVGYDWIERRERELHLHALFVFPPHRGQGIGSAAIQALEEEFRQEADFIELGVEESNEQARSLYERLGFVVEGRMLDLGFLILRKRLGGEQPATLVPLVRGPARERRWGSAGEARD
jgi:ribosomal protein S18 acetylase RimI-like enzyme